MPTQKIRTFLWFDRQAEEAAQFYVSLFPNSRNTKVTRYGEGAPTPAGQVMTVEFELSGVQLIALNGGPHFQFNEAISLSVDCHSQDEIDYYWERLGENGPPGQCGWLKDRFGVSWQIVPNQLPDLLSDPDPERSRRVMRAMLQMKKLDVDQLKRAHQGV